MPKIKTSISLDEKLLAELDKQAEADGISRSELIERICRRTLDDEPKVEFFRLHGMPTQLVSAHQLTHFHFQVPKSSFHHFPEYSTTNVNQMYDATHHFTITIFQC